MKLSNQLTIHASADHVWKIIAHEFDKIGEWASNVPESAVNAKAAVPEGATVGGRVCIVPGFGHVEETFIAYSEADKTFTYEALAGLPFFVKSAQNSWVVRPLDNQTTEVAFAAEIKLLPLLGTLLAIPMRFQLNRIVKETTEELKHFIEKGEAHPRKAQQLAKKVNLAAG